MAIATQNAVKNAILESDIHAITDVEYSGEDARKWKRSITAVAKNIPSKAGGAAGAHGHTYVAKTNAQFLMRASVNPTLAVNPGRLTFTHGIAAELHSITMSQEQEDHEVGLEAFNTQEGVSSGLCNTIIDSVPEQLLVELEDDKTGFDVVDPKDMIAEVIANTTPDTTLEAIDLIKRRDAPLVFDTETKLSLQLNQRQKDINDLRRVHQVETSKTGFIAKMRSHVQEEGGEDYEDKAAEWKAKTTNNALADFKVFFINRDNIVCDRNKHKRTKAKDSGFHSANSAKKIEDNLAENLKTTMAALALATKETINKALGKIAGNGEKSSVLEAVKELAKEVTAFKKKNTQKPRSNKGGGGGRSGGGGGDTSGGGGNKKKCKYCDKPHLEKTPEELCFERPENASEVPEWYKRTKARCAERDANN